jgi:hypothetical protein
MSKNQTIFSENDTIGADSNLGRKNDQFANAHCVPFNIYIKFETQYIMMGFSKMIKRIEKKCAFSTETKVKFEHDKPIK